VSGDSGQDIVNGGTGEDTLSGGSGPDTIDGGGVSEIYGGPGVDDLTGSTDATDDIYGGSGDDFLDAVDGREDFVDCGRLESLTAGGFDTDTALIDEIDITVECESTVVSSPNP
jgi:Ca2+-binding RTX toxin-like protein